jgi:hypothetical protein
MVLLRSARIGLGAALCALFSLGWAWPSGKYREEVRNPFPRSDTSLIRTLNLYRDGKAELYSEYRGDRPEVNSAVRAVLGGLMNEVQDHRKIRHEGQWRRSGGRIVVELDRLDAGGDERRVASTIEFEDTRQDLRAVRQDESDYGSRRMRLDPLEDWGSEDQGDDFDTGASKGTYGWGEEVKAEDGRSFYSRRLKLNGDRSAELISEYQGSRPRVDQGVLDQYGVLFSQVAANKKISHKGQWREDRNGIRVELDRVGGGLFAERVSSTFLFERNGDTLTPREFDRTDYGSRSVRLRKDWSSDFDDRPRPPDRPTPLPGGEGTELDTAVDGGGMLSYEGTRARELGRARLTLRKDGRFEIRVSGQGSEVFAGRYDLDRNNRVNLEVRDAFGRSATGRGHATLRKGDLGTIELRGEAGGRRFTLNFTGRS